ncbi:hypothetical protein [Nonomuraea insulae]|uniref:Uncharacterized protein n=1 Tax=Nonomuraea insulae TaxID=1616787 RepID=A0ABW1CGI6_9ACTN
MSTTMFDTAITQARDLLRWRSPLRTELWAARLTAELETGGKVAEFLRRAKEDGRQEARLALAALAAVNGPAEVSAREDDRYVGTQDDDHDPDAQDNDRDAREQDGDREAGALDDDHDASVQDGDRDAAVARPYTVAGAGVADSLPGWVRRMGRVSCDGGWYGKADPYGEQVLAVLAFRYENGKEAHILVTGIDQPQGGLAVDALVEEVKFLDDLGLRKANPQVVARRILDAFELGDRILGATVADTLPMIRPLALARALSVADTGALSVTDDTVAAFQDLPELPGAREAFGKLVEFVGDRPLWWSPGRVSQFLTSWLPREAILSEDAIAAMPEVVRAWSRYCGDQPAVLRQIDEDVPRLPALMADDSLAGLGKRLAQNRHP